MKDCNFIPYSEKDNSDYECGNWKPALYTVICPNEPDQPERHVCADDLPSMCAVLSSRFGRLVVFLIQDDKPYVRPWF